jgi:peptide/nickel transport system permease protein
MLGFFARRLLLAIPVLLGVTTITYLTMAASAGDYVPGVTLESNLRPEDIDRLRASLGLDQPLYIQYLRWLAQLVRGDLGRSMIDGTPVIGQILERLPNTLLLAVTAILLGGTLGAVVGVASAVNRDRFADKFLSGVAVAGFAVPQFWLGLLLILLFAVGFRAWGLPALPSSGAYDPVSGGGLGDRFVHLILPAVTLSFFYLSVWSRYVRSSMLGVLSQEYVRTARAKGVHEQTVLLRHALRNALMPLVTLIGLELPRLVSGALVIEVIFAWPGIGRLAYERALAYDYTAVMGVTTFVAAMVIFGSIMADFLYGVLDPRIKVQ